MRPCTSCTCRPRAPWRRWPRRAPRARTPSPKPAPSTFFLSSDDLAREGFEGAKYVCSPPLRGRGAPGQPVAGPAHQRPVGRFHRPLPLLLQGTKGAWTRRLLQDPQRHPRGRAPGRPHLPGRLAGEISLSRWVEVNSTTPARMFGLYPRKGVLAPGSDADIVLYDPAATQTISAATHHMSVDYSAYEGKAITGRRRHGPVPRPRS